jgi:pimeloyl-ACP methyl ester carboxylesterase
MRRAALAVFLFAIAEPAAAAGPDLSVPPEKLKAALGCKEPAADAPRRVPVLLVHGTGSSGEENWFAYLRVLPARGHPTCAVSIPDREADSTTENSQFVVYAARRMRDRFGGRIAIMGHSQGSMLERWAMRWWPDVGAGVDDVISLAGPLKGSPYSKALCLAFPCVEWMHNSVEGSPFMTAINEPAMTPFPADATSLLTEYDELVQPPSIAMYDPAPRTSSVLLQSVCPGRRAEHGAMAIDALAYALVLDALDHPGPANPARIDRAVCDKDFIEGTNVADAPGPVIGLPQVIVKGIQEGNPTIGPPPLPAYVKGHRDTFGALDVTVRPSRARLRRRRRFRVQVTTEGVPVRYARVWLGRRRGKTGQNGAVRIRARLRALGRRTVLAAAPGYLPGRTGVRVRQARRRR